MIHLVSYSEDPERKPRHVVAVARNGELLVRTDQTWAESFSSARFQSDALQKQRELLEQVRAADLNAWFSRQGLCVGLVAIESELSPEYWFAHPLEPNAHFVYDLSHVFPRAAPKGWFECVEAIARKYMATADHPMATNRGVHCLIRRPILQAMDPEELATMRAEVRAALDELAAKRDAA